jgi:hypothetical protein
MMIALLSVLVIGIVICGLCIWGAYNDYNDAEQYKCDINDEQSKQ